MKIGILSDIHAEPQALRRVLADMPSVDRVLCAGDAVSEYQFCAETVQLLQHVNAQCIQGNHEMVLFSGRNAAYLSKCQAEFAPALLDVLATAPTSLALGAPWPVAKGRTQRGGRTPSPRSWRSRRPVPAPR